MPAVKAILWKAVGMMEIPTPLQSARDKGGRRFQPDKEQELEESALRASRALPGAGHGLIVLKEVVGPVGIPDLVAMVGDEGAVSKRLKLAVPPLLNEVDAAIVGAAAVRASRRVSTLARTLGWPVDTLNRRLPGLLRSGALVETAPGVLVRPEGLRPIGRLYAFEIKVDNWKRAVRQGRGYRVWCDAYVVVMDSLSTRSLSELTAAADQDGAGVVIGGRWLSRPKVTAREEWRRLWGSEHVVAALGHG